MSISLIQDCIIIIYICLFLLLLPLLVSILFIYTFIMKYSGRHSGHPWETSIMDTSKNYIECFCGKIVGMSVRM